MLRHDTEWFGTPLARKHTSFPLPRQAVPGTPDHPIGLAGTVAVATVVASLATGAARMATTLPRAAVGGVCYVLVLLGVWAGSRHLFYRIPRSREHTLWLGVCVVVLGVQWTVPVVVTAVTGSVLPHLWLFGSTAFTAAVFFQVGGEGSILFIWPGVFAPLSLGVLAVLVAAELVVVPLAVGMFLERLPGTV
jgi:hypothetical protein